MTPPNNFTSHGVLRNFNTVEDFQNCDMKELLHERGYKVKTIYRFVHTHVMFDSLESL